MGAMTYDQKIRECFKAVCKRNKDKKASAAEVTEEMEKRGWLSEMDTVIDIADLMRNMREVAGG